MPDFELSAHARDMLAERNIPEEWVWRAVRLPTGEHRGADGNLHYIKVIDEAGGRFLRVIVNAEAEPQRVVTVFFDRRPMRKT